MSGLSQESDGMKEAAFWRLARQAARTLRGDNEAWHAELRDRRLWESLNAPIGFWAVAKNEERFFLGRDNSSHWYLISLAHHEEYIRWSSLNEDDPESWVVPDWMKRLNGSPSRITFTDPQEM